MNGKTKLWASALLLGVLAVGGVAGAAADRIVLRDDACRAHDRRDDDDDDRRDHEGYLDRLSAELALTAEQRAELATVIERHRGRFSDFWSEIGPQLDEMRAEYRADVRAVLTPEQQERYDRLRNDRDRRRGSDRHDKNGESKGRR